MSDDTRPLLSTWSARKAHIDSGKKGRHDSPVTLCSQYGTTAGELTVRGPIKQEAIDALPVCGLCSRRQPKETR